MNRNTQTLVLSPWMGGLNSAQDPIVLGLTPNGQQMLTEAENIIFTTTGGRKKRGGQSHFNSTQMTDNSSAASAVDGIYATTYWYLGTSTTKAEDLVVVAEQGRIYHAPAYGSLSALNISSTITPTFSQGLVTSEVMNDVLFIGYSKTLSPLTYAGSSATVSIASASSLVSGTFPAGYLLRQHLNRLFIAGNGAFPDRLYYSSTELPFTHNSSAGFIDIMPGDGDPDGITAIFPPVNTSELYIAKRQSIYKIDTSSIDPTDWAVIPMSRGIGCVQHNSVVAIDQGDIFFASDRGIHSLQQVISQTAVIMGKFLSAPIQTAYDAADNKRLISAIWAPDLNSYLFSVQREGTTFSETIYGYNVELGNWYEWTSVPCNFLIRRLNTSTESYEYYACGDGANAANKGYVNKLQQTNLWDFSSSTGNITTRISTGLLYAGGDFLIEKNFLNIILLVRSRDDSPIQVSYEIDEITNGAGMLQQRVIGGNILGSSLSILGTTFVLGSPFGSKPLFLHTAGVGNAIQVTILHDTIDGDLEIYGLAIEMAGAGESQNAYRTFPAT